MRKMIKVKRMHGDALINPEHIVCILPIMHDMQMRSEITMITGLQVPVMETQDQLIKMLEKEGNE